MGHDMTNKRSLKSTMIFFLVVAAFLCVWLLFIAPRFQEQERLVRSENAALVMDLAEIESMDGSTDELDRKIAGTEGSIRQKFTSRADNADAAAGRIEEICRGLGYFPSRIALGPQALLHPAGVLTPAFYSVDITFQIDSDAAAGAAVIRGLENSPSADFEVVSFVYRAFKPESAGEDADEDEGGDEEAVEDVANYGEWIFTVTLYFYE